MGYLITDHRVSRCFGTNRPDLQFTNFTSHTGNLTPQETTNQDAPDMGADGGDLSCPGSSVVATGIHGRDQNENKSSQVEN